MGQGMAERYCKCYRKGFNGTDNFEQGNLYV